MTLEAFNKEIEEHSSSFASKFNAKTKICKCIMKGNFIEAEKLILQLRDCLGKTFPKILYEFRKQSIMELKRVGVPSKLLRATLSEYSNDLSADDMEALCEMANFELKAEDSTIMQGRVNCIEKIKPILLSLDSAFSPNKARNGFISLLEEAVNNFAKENPDKVKNLHQPKIFSQKSSPFKVETRKGSITNSIVSKKETKDTTTIPITRIFKEQIQSCKSIFPN